MVEKEVKNGSEKVVNKKVKGKIWLLFGISVLAVLILLSMYFCFPRIEFKGKKTIVLNYKELYKEPGYTAEAFGKDITKDVKVSGKVDSSKLGTYKIVYEAKGIFKRKVERTVQVKDISKPAIKISEEKKVYLCPGAKFQGLEVSAFDNYDGDLTSKIQVKEEKDQVIYSVEDSSGNKQTVVKELVYEDKEAPVINLNGSKYVYAFLNEKYMDPFVSVNDNCGGDLSSKVKVDGGVDTGKTGKYEVTYSVTDDGGNTASVSRTVVVSERGKPGTIYLTFDDGPQNGTTNVILDILKEEGVEATFFVTNKGPDALIKRIYDEGHTVALHTASHDYATVYASVDSYFNDLNTVNERVKRITGSYSYIIRFPGGSSNTVSRRYSPGIMTTLTQEVINRGYKYYDWNVSSGDAAGGSPTPEQIKNNVVNSLRKDRINMVLMHDIKTYTRDALRSIITYGKENGYTFEKITASTEMVRQRVNN